MKIRIFFLTMIMLGSGIARADVQSDTACYVHVPHDEVSKHIRFVVRSYFDNDLKKEIGAFVQYNGSKEIIPLVFTKYVATDTDSPGLGNYEISRIEINNKKVTGEYIFYQTGAGHTQGKYVKYINEKTGKTTSFMETDADDPSCKINK